MNRKIEFRGIRKDNLNKFIYGFLMSPERINSINEGVVEVMPETVGQYTGLKDCNGVKIFEGDIVIDMDGKKATVCFNNASFTLLKNRHFIIGEKRASKIEVIGNIHE